MNFCEPLSLPIHGLSTQNIQKHVLKLKVHKNSSGGIVTVFWAGQLRNHGSIPSSQKRFISSLKCPCQVWGSPSLPIIGCQRFSIQGQSGQDMNLTYLDLLPRLNMTAAIVCTQTTSLARPFQLHFPYSILWCS